MKKRISNRIEATFEHKQTKDARRYFETNGWRIPSVLKKDNIV